MKNTPSDTDFFRREIQIQRLKDSLIFVPMVLTLFFLTPLVDFAQYPEDSFNWPWKYFTVLGVWLMGIIFIAGLNYRLKNTLNEREQ